MNVWKLIAEKGREVFSSKIIYVDKECKAFFFCFFFCLSFFLVTGLESWEETFIGGALEKKSYALYSTVCPLFLSLDSAKVPEVFQSICKKFGHGRRIPMQKFHI